MRWGRRRRKGARGSISQRCSCECHGDFPENIGNIIPFHHLPICQRLSLVFIGYSVYTAYAVLDEIAVFRLSVKTARNTACKFPSALYERVGFTV